MKTRRQKLLAAALLVLLGFSARGEEAVPFRVIVHPSSVINTIGREELSRIFLRKQRAWRYGEVAMPVDQGEYSRVRDAFTTAVHQRSVDAVVRYWQQLVFSGRGAPPPVKPNDASVVEYVAENPGAIGYVTLNAKLNGVKVIQVQE
jgi:ABC-type phosphate transport system substrate-binding protein